MPTIEIDGSSLFYLEFGDAGNPPLVMLHGLYGDSSTMASLAERFADRFRVFAPDALGHGRSSRPAGFTLEDQGRVLNGFVAAFGYDSAALLGVSMGSYLVTEAAILEPARTSKLVLVVPKAHGTTSSSVAYARRMGFDLSAASPEEMVAFMAGALWSPHTSQERRDELLADAQPESQIVLTAEERDAVERSLAGFDLRPGLPSITAPTLVISGAADGLNPPAAGEELARLIPDAHFEVYEHSGHMLAAEETDRLVAEVTGFLLG
jgi:3-oxoadipate enol-lactonase